MSKNVHVSVTQCAMCNAQCTMHNQHTMQAHQMSHEGLMEDFGIFVITLGDNKHSYQKIRPFYADFE